MRKRARGIIIDHGIITLIKRVKNGNTYYVCPGGGVERGESILEALIREIKEELGINVAIGWLIASIPYKRLGEIEMEYFYLCQTSGGTLGTGDGPEFQPGNDPRHGTYEVVQAPLSEIAKLNLLPETVKNTIVSSVKS